MIDEEKGYDPKKWEWVPFHDGRMGHLLRIPSAKEVTREDVLDCPAFQGRWPDQQFQVVTDGTWIVWHLVSRYMGGPLNLETTHARNLGEMVEYLNADGGRVHKWLKSI
jgi:hypothetical protein